MKERHPRDVTINLRANRRQRALIDRAAEATGKNRSDFVLEARVAKLRLCSSMAGYSCSMRRPTGDSSRHSPTPRRQPKPAPFPNVESALGSMIACAEPDHLRFLRPWSMVSNAVY